MSLAIASTPAPIVAANIASPLTLPCGAVIPNRIAKSAMTEGLADGDDLPTPQLNQLYQRWAEGGAGLLITGNVMVDRRYLERSGNVVLENAEALSRFRLWAEVVTECDVHLWMQLNHPGRQCSRFSNSKPVAPSAVQLRMAGNFAMPRILPGSEINAIIRRFGVSAALAREAGFTGVQIHSAHGYLGSQFLSPLTNQRKDEWGGSLENRARFLLATVEEVRARVGADFPVAVKLNSADFQQGGFAIDECVEVARWLQQAGVDLLELSGGAYENPAFLATESDKRPAGAWRREAFFLEYAEAVAKAVTTPLMVTGGFRSRPGMNDAIAAGATQMIGVARPFCTDPDFPRKLFAGAIARTHPTEKELALAGYWGPQSPSKLVRALNNQAQAAWYYQQILHLSNRRQPDLNLGLGSALRSHLLNEMRLSLRRSR
ncbi:NADH:flavin oxidoreductase, Old Yellow Enzyme family [Hahella chejuensis KCTC 2396]|uniref:NADH:flavin oxidoreductase, Old Yellow Enzyme family n=1 Tax=Hahella chejuensis (strain KCTC 2396) TaxID=349521 RepID=Q2SLZ7_HAHCH|nr:NADH:flavin oxidoreductase/NADH oxidase family protein [Hahella chejuensis]ABC28327.1 NADH:flavin oxidoreductase, Old Yellow Enzyme family [Hahella chejuensis KCTC 2396]